MYIMYLCTVLVILLNISHDSFLTCGHLVHHLTSSS